MYRTLSPFKIATLVALSMLAFVAAAFGHFEALFIAPAVAADWDTLNKLMDKIELKLASLPELADRVLMLEQRHSRPPADPGTDPGALPDRSRGGLVLHSAQDFRRHFRGSADEDVGVADFLRAVAGMKASAAATKSLTVGTDTDGGYAVPRGTAGNILSAMVPNSALLQAGAGYIPIGPMKTLTTAAVNAIPDADWREEGGPVVESEPTFRGIVTTPRSLSFRFKVSRELLADAPGMDMALEVVIAQALAKALDRTGLRGIGTAPEPRGIRNTSGVHIKTSGDNGASGPGWDRILSAYQDILQADCPAPTACIMSPRSWARLVGGTDLQGQPLQAPPALGNLKLLTTSQIPNDLVTGTSDDTTEIYLGDFSLMNFMGREQLTIQRAGELYAETGEIGFFGHARVDVSIWYPAAFSVVTGLR